ncbi:SIR2 family protein [Skermanella mucosa]|uniref:SIR2 family protein n=1 Tax=Skermanella mucosa TaxID=1789672 RepID=UPI00192B5D0E|nr:SIR2 family protein [Skermanella mucosa]UEM21099.1 SIR2 family protein [Skermanella mucosa]
MKQPLLERIDDLADRILAGEVVFFVGAGFSLDTEKNSAKRLVSRLLARFCALHRVLTGEIRWLVDHEKARDNAKALHRGLMTTFNLDKHVKECGLIAEQFEPNTWAKVKADKQIEKLKNNIILTLAREYYLFNDWMCNAYDEMLDHMLGQAMTGQAKRTIQAELSVADRFFLDLLKNSDETSELEPVNLDRLRSLASPSRGKALFLDAMGFRQPEVMGGDPDNRDLQKVIDSYHGRLLPRHHLLARLAREGLCPTLITTNFDLLLEGAYRLAGFQPRRGPAGEEAVAREAASDRPADPNADPGAGPPCFPPTRWPSYERITRAHQYYYRPSRNRVSGKPQPEEKPIGSPPTLKGGQQAASIVKIHGCAETYRHACDGPSEESGTLPEVLSSLVFTFREIQNWRQDSWSRDLLLTLLRTRTMVFCGYSTADPVLHDTFRTVYEEMASRFKRHAFAETGERRQADAPAFFLAGAQSREFHALEVLRSASHAIGVNRVSLTEHPNYLEFFFRNDDHCRFPDMDELLSWLFHRVYRLRQRQALESELRSIATLLMKEVSVESEAVKRIIESFDKLCVAECKSVMDVASTQSEDKAVIRSAAEHARFALERVTGWTSHFHPRLLREFALAGLRLRKGYVGTDEIRSLRNTPWYFAAGENFGWTAWGVVVELALRRAVTLMSVGENGDWCDPQHWHPPGPWIEVSPGDFPVVDLSLDKDCPSPVRLVIRHRELDEPVSATVENDGLPRRRITWNLSLDRLPWSRGKGDDLTPDAESLWAWASSSGKEKDGVPKDGKAWYEKMVEAVKHEDLPDADTKGGLS